MYSVVIGVQHIEQDFVFDTQGWVGWVGSRSKVKVYRTWSSGLSN